MVEPQSSKLMTWVRFPSPAPGSRCPTQHRAHVAQSVEHVLGKDEVTGSIPVVGSIAGPMKAKVVARLIAKID